MATYGQIRGKGQLTIPGEIRDAARLETGAMVEFEVTEEGVLLRPKAVVDADDAWFWTQEWQAGEREAQAQLVSGEGEREVLTHEGFMQALEKRPG